MFPLLSLITFLPLTGGIVVLCLPRERVRIIRWAALGFAWADLMIVLGLALGYSQAVPNFDATIVGAGATAAYYTGVHEQVAWIATQGFSLNYSLDVDGISLLLVILTSLLTVVCIGASFRIEQKVKNYMAFMLLLESGIIGVFLASNLFLFYIFWELMLIPAYFLVGSWGGEHRIYAAIKFVQIGKWHYRRLPCLESLPVLHLLGVDADPRLFPGGKLGRRAPHLRCYQVCTLYFRRQPAHAGRHHRAWLLSPALGGRWLYA